MPTGYTSYINDGKITNGADFLKLCTRAFGVAVDLKDESLFVPTPEHFEPDPYYKESYEKAVNKRNRYKKMTVDEARQEFVEKEIKSLNSSKECLSKIIEENDRYRSVKIEVEKWIPPTSNHEKLKEFAINQLNISMNSKDYIDFFRQGSDKIIDDSEENIINYLHDMQETCEKKVIRSYKKWQENIKETEEKNLWMKQFLDSLETISNETRV